MATNPNPLSGTRLSTPLADIAYIALVDPNAMPAVFPRFIKFQYMPESIGENKSANWQYIDILGRSEPIRFYSSSGPRSINLCLTFHALSSRIDDVELKIRFLRSLVYPDYQASKSTNTPFPPPVILLKIGEWLKMRSIVTNISVNRSGPWEPDTLYPTCAEVSLDIQELNVDPFDATDVFFGDDMTSFPVEKQVTSSATPAASNGGNLAAQQSVLGNIVSVLGAGAAVAAGVVGAVGTVSAATNAIQNAAKALKSK